MLNKISDSDSEWKHSFVDALRPEMHNFRFIPVNSKSPFTTPFP